MSGRPRSSVKMRRTNLADRVSRAASAFWSALGRMLLAGAFATALSSCAKNESYRAAREQALIPEATLALMSEKGMAMAAPIVMRSYKKEAELEIWKLNQSGKYALLKTYPVCRWSGQLGPKLREGDRQAPEGFYAVTTAAMNPRSSLFLSFNIGYPNGFDRMHRRTGSHLMVHGACSSQGCFAMTDEAMSEIYAIAREAFSAGQASFQFQSYPFRMTSENLAKHRADPHFAFWKNLKEGSDVFEVTAQEPIWTVSGGRYVFAREPAFASEIAAKTAKDDSAAAALVTKGLSAVRLVYQDGGGHPSLKKMALAAASAEASVVLDEHTRRSLGDISRPDALASEPQEIPVTAAPPEAPRPLPR